VGGWTIGVVGEPPRVIVSDDTKYHFGGQGAGRRFTDDLVALGERACKSASRVVRYT
jgi:hypothetical protein